MSTKTTRRRSGRTARPRPGRPDSGRTAWHLAVLTGVLLAAPMGAPAAAQDVCDERAGTLGIQGMRCEGCTFSMSREGMTEARFRTEPQVLAVARGFADGDRLRAGDRIVAIDGALITTRSGSDRLVDLRAGQEVTVRVRRDGRMEELRIVAGSACELTRLARSEEIELERMPDAELPPGYAGVKLPAPPAAAPLPAMPPMPTMPPTAYLGFGIKCGPCGLRDGVRFFDENPPVVTNVSEDGPADEAGLEPDDVILAIDGLDITGSEGGKRFGEIEPGEPVELTVRRGGERLTVTLEAGERVVGRAPPVAAPSPPAPRLPSDRLRFEGSLGDVGIEVRGAPVTVTRDEETGEIVIRTGTNVIRLVRPRG